MPGNPNELYIDLPTDIYTNCIIMQFGTGTSFPLTAHVEISYQDPTPPTNVYTVSSIVYNLTFNTNTSYAITNLRINQSRSFRVRTFVYTGGNPANGTWSNYSAIVVAPAIPYLFPTYTGPLTILSNTGSGLCIHENMEIDGIPIKNIKQMTLTNGIEILDNIKMGKTNNFVKFNKDSIKPNIPNKDLLLTDTHLINIDGEITCGKNLINNNDKYKNSIKYINLDKTVDVYNLVTKEKTYVEIQGVLCETVPLHEMQYIFKKISYA
jgi:hypothetical protein